MVGVISEVGDGVGTGIVGVLVARGVANGWCVAVAIGVCVAIAAGVAVTVGMGTLGVSRARTCGPAM